MSHTLVAVRDPFIIRPKFALTIRRVTASPSKVVISSFRVFWRAVSRYIRSECLTELYGMTSLVNVRFKLSFLIIGSVDEHQHLPPGGQRRRKKTNRRRHTHRNASCRLRLLLFLTESSSLPKTTVTDFRVGFLSGRRLPLVALMRLTLFSPLSFSLSFPLKELLRMICLDLSG